MHKSKHTYLFAHTILVFHQVGDIRGDVDRKRRLKNILK